MNESNQNFSLTDDDHWTADEKTLLSDLVVTEEYTSILDSKHQSDLRQQMLDAFDRSPPVAPSVSRSKASGNLVWIAVVAGLAACVLAIASYAIVGGNQGGGGSIADQDAQPLSEVDAEYVAAIQTVTEYRDEVSQEELFFALAMCQQDSSPSLSLQKRN